MRTSPTTSYGPHDWKLGTFTETLAGMREGPLWLQKQVFLCLVSIISSGIVMLFVWGFGFWFVLVLLLGFFCGTDRKGKQDLDLLLKTKYIKYKPHQLWVEECNSRCLDVCKTSKHLKQNLWLFHLPTPVLYHCSLNFTWAISVLHCWEQGIKPPVKNFSDKNHHYKT